MAGERPRRRAPDLTTAAPSAVRAGAEMDVTPPPAAAPAMSDIPRKEARKIGHPGGTTVPLSALVVGRPDPDVDLVSVNHALPRYVVDAIAVTSMLTRRSRKDIVRDALCGIPLDSDLLARCRAEYEE